MQRNVPVSSTSQRAAASQSSASATPVSTRAAGLPSALGLRQRACHRAVQPGAQLRALPDRCHLDGQQRRRSPPGLPSGGARKIRRSRPPTRPGARASPPAPRWPRSGRRPAPNAAMNGGTANRPIRSARSAASRVEREQGDCHPERQRQPEGPGAPLGHQVEPFLHYGVKVPAVGRFPWCNVILARHGLSRGARSGQLAGAEMLLRMTGAGGRLANVLAAAPFLQGARHRGAVAVYAAPGDLAVLHPPHPCCRRVDLEAVAGAGPDTPHHDHVVAHLAVALGLDLELGSRAVSASWK